MVAFLGDLGSGVLILVQGVAGISKFQQKAGTTGECGTHLEICTELAEKNQCAFVEPKSLVRPPLQPTKFTQRKYRLPLRKPFAKNNEGLFGLDEIVGRVGKLPARRCYMSSGEKNKSVLGCE